MEGRIPSMCSPTMKKSTRSLTLSMKFSSCSPGVLMKVERQQRLRTNIQMQDGDNQAWHENIWVNVIWFSIFGHGEW